MVVNYILGYLQGAEDHWTQIRATTEDGVSCTGVDLWHTNEPAYGYNGTYGGYIYGTQAINIIKNHNSNNNTKNKPLFLYLAIQNNHYPYEVPSSYSNKFNSSWYDTQRIVAGQSNFVDEMLKNLTNLIKSSGNNNNMWDNTLFIITSDNGGPSGTDGNGGNNCPLRGGKYSNFQGGVHVNAIVSGGIIPNNRKNITLNGLMHITDWYHTFCYLAGINASDIRASKAGLPQIDSINMWDYLIGNYTNTNKLNDSYSGRNDIYLMSGNTGGYIKGQYKILFGKQAPAFWTTYDYPNGTNGKPEYIECGSIQTQGCFFDLKNDPTEHHNLINNSNYSQVIEILRGEFINKSKTTWDMDRGAVDSTCCQQIAINGGYWGPWLN